jgi:hypothetical protein
MDGDLIATLADGRTHVLPVDVYTPDELANDVVKPPFGDGFGIATATRVRTIDDIHQAVLAWCAAQLGRADVNFREPR